MSLEILTLFLFAIMCIIYTFGMGSEPKKELPKSNAAQKPTPIIPIADRAPPIPQTVFGGAQEETPMDRELDNLNSSITEKIEAMKVELPDEPLIEELRVPDAATSSTILSRDNDPELVAHYNDLRDKLSAVDSANKQKIIIGYHYADWCKYCNEFKPTWQSLERTVSKNPRFSNIKLTLVDHDVNKLRSLKTIPAIIKSRPDGTIERYSGPRTARRILRWCIS